MKLVLKPTSGETDVKLIAMIHGWPLQRENAAEATIPRQILWATPEGTTTIVYVEDQILSTRYLMVSGPEETKVQKQVGDGLEVYTLDDLRRLSLPDLPAQEAMHLVNVAASMAPANYDAEFFELMSKALRHPDVDVRRTAIFAITYVPWRQFRELLAEMGANDPAVARDVRVVIDAVDAQGWR